MPDAKSLTSTPQVVHNISTVTNFVVRTYTGSDGKDVDVFEGRPLDEIAIDVLSKTGNWPRRVGPQLFALIDDKVSRIGSFSALAAWLADRHVIFDWRSNSRAVYIKMPAKSDLLAYLQISGEAYTSIHDLPHYPPIPSAFYSPAADIKPFLSGAFLKLLSFFRPASDEDRIFLAALFLTPFWGGQPGGRPMFVIEGPDNDPDGGRGVGKSELVDIVAQLAGGYIDVPETIRDPDEIKKRIVNNESSARIVRYDNVKKNRFSSSVFESLITSSAISGHKLFKGHVTTPNHFTYVVTFNDASLSKDLATRAVRVRLARPESMRATWGDEVRTYVETHREAILGDILWLLAEPSAALSLEFRFPAWVEGVLAKVAGDDDQGMLEKILADRAHMDDEAGEIDDIEQVVHNRLRAYRFSGYGTRAFDPDTMNMFIPWIVLTKWLREDMGLVHDVRFLSRKVGRSRSRLSPRYIRSSRGVMWVAVPGHEYAYRCPPDIKMTHLDDHNEHKVSLRSSATDPNHHLM